MKIIATIWLLIASTFCAPAWAEWKIEEGKDAITDVKSVMLVGSAVEPRGFLGFRCEPGKARLAVIAFIPGLYVSSSSKSTEVVYRLGSEPPVTASWVGGAGSVGSVDAAEAGRIAYGLKAVDRIVIRVTRFDGRRVDITALTDGFAAALDEFRKRCGI